jgi:malate/lactate dehydrogenase
MTITIIGSGRVGASVALNSGLRELDRDILLVDIVQGLPQGEAMDINHQLSLLYEVQTITKTYATLIVLWLLQASEESRG